LLLSTTSDSFSLSIQLIIIQTARSAIASLSPSPPPQTALTRAPRLTPLPDSKCKLFFLGGLNRGKGLARRKVAALRRAESWLANN